MAIAKTRRHRGTLVLLAATLALGACTSGDDGTRPTGPTTGPRSADGTDDGTGTISGSGGRPALAAGRLGLRLSEGEAVNAAPPAVARVDGVPLSPERIAEIEAGLPEWDDAGATTDVFRWPTESLPPPVAGTTLAEPFPPLSDSAPPDVSTSPLEVLRHQPDGAVDIAPFVTITFNQPMVPVGTVGQVSGAEVPATITPALAGRWQWIGTRTLRFDHESDLIDRLPMAMEYTVVVPAGTRSATGSVLAQDVRFTFSTPPVSVETFQPQETSSLPLTPVFLAVFDQRVDAATMLGAITVRADGDRRSIRLATDEEIADDEDVSATIGAAPEGRFIAFRPVDPFPTDAAITVDIGPGRAIR